MKQLILKAIQSAMIITITSCSAASNVPSYLQKNENMNMVQREVIYQCENRWAEYPMTKSLRQKLMSEFENDNAEEYMILESGNSGNYLYSSSYLNLNSDTLKFINISAENMKIKFTENKLKLKINELKSILLNISNIRYTEKLDDSSSKLPCNFLSIKLNNKIYNFTYFSNNSWLTNEQLETVNMKLTQEEAILKKVINIFNES
jgi:hypothetical protein